MKRHRAPVAKPGELKAKWGTNEGCTAIHYAWGASGASKSDSRILMTALEEAVVFDGRPLAEELKRRGYDLTTLRFSVKQLPCDNGSDRNGEDGLPSEGEASQSGAEGNRQTLPVFTPKRQRWGNE